MPQQGRFALTNCAACTKMALRGTVQRNQQRRFADRTCGPCVSHTTLSVLLAALGCPSTPGQGMEEAVAAS